MAPREQWNRVYPQLLSDSFSAVGTLPLPAAMFDADIQPLRQAAAIEAARLGVQWIDQNSWTTGDTEGNSWPISKWARTQRSSVRAQWPVGAVGIRRLAGSLPNGAREADRAGRTSVERSYRVMRSWFRSTPQGCRRSVIALPIRRLHRLFCSRCLMPPSPPTNCSDS